MYNRTVFKADSELQKQESFHNIQSFIEEPEIHLIAMSSSCGEDQATLIQDRLKCIRDLATDIYTSIGIIVTDRPMFFYVDKPAAQFERGTQQGGLGRNKGVVTHVEHVDVMRGNLMTWHTV